MVDLSKAYDRMNISSLCDKVKVTYLPGQIVNLIEFMGINICTCYEGCLSDELIVYNGVCQGGILFNFYLNEVLFDLADLPPGC